MKATLGSPSRVTAAIDTELTAVAMSKARRLLINNIMYPPYLTEIAVN
jgi:hypothetical protein